MKPSRWVWREGVFDEEESARRTRRTHTSAFKAQVALADLREDKSLADLASSSSCTPTKSPIGSASCSSTQPMPSAAVKRPSRWTLAPLHAKIGQLHREGIKVGRRHIGTLMQRMGIAALAPQPRTSKRTPDNKIYPYLLRKLSITRANHNSAPSVIHPKSTYKSGNAVQTSGAASITWPDDHACISFFFY